MGGQDGASGNWEGAMGELARGSWGRGAQQPCRAYQSLPTHEIIPEVAVRAQDIEGDAGVRVEIQAALGFLGGDQLKRGVVAPLVRDVDKLLEFHGRRLSAVRVCSAPLSQARSVPPPLHRPREESCPWRAPLCFISADGDRERAGAAPLAADCVQLPDCNTPPRTPARSIARAHAAQFERA